MPDDYSAGRFTTGTVAVGDTATGNIESSRDRDWFAVELVAGRTYVIDLRGSPTGDGTLSDPYLRGIHDSDGNLIPRTTNDDGGQDYNSRVTFTATESGTHYIAAGVYFGRGTYEVEVTDTSPPIVAPDPDSEDPPDTQEQVQQQPPAFGSQFYGFDLPEDTDGSANRISLGTVSATDPDGGSVTYSIEGGNAAGLFEIDAASGELFYTGGGEDYETGSTSFELTVRASEGDQTTDTTVAVNVTDVAEAPAFGQAGYGFDLAEDTDGSANRISLGTVSATDPDGGSVTYSIEGGNAAGLFEIDAASGELFYTGGGEDYETGSTSFELTVRASDGDQTTDTTATVSVTDVDEPVEVDPPVAQPDPARAAAEDLGDITELAAPLFPLGTLDGAADGVAWYRFTLSEAREVALGLRRQDADADLVVEDAAGNVLHRGANDGTANEWVRETLLAGTYYVRVEAQEAGANAYVFRYGVGDADPAEVTRLEAEQASEQEQVQQQPPAFGSQVYGFELPENTDGSADRLSLGTVSATDPDGRSVTYSIEGGNAAGLFEIDAASGELFYTGGGEDYESSSTSFELTVRASDGDQTTDTPVAVNVTDVAEAPAFAQAGYGFELPENTDGSADRLSLGTVSATDPDGRSVTYSIEGGNAAGLFEIDAASGELFYTGGGEDYDTGSTSFELTVRASDGDQTTDTTVAVSVTDVDEPVVVDPPVAQPDQSTPQTVSEPAGEDFSAGTSTIGRVAVGDTATGNIEPSHDRDWFAVELVAGRTYVIDLRGSPTNDGTLRDPYLRGIHDSDGNLIPRTTNDDGGQGLNSRVTFTATESGTHYIAAGVYSGQGTYEVEVTDTSPPIVAPDPDPEDPPVTPEQVQQQPPAFGSQVYGFELPENTDGSADRLSLGTVSATDPDGRSVTYSIEGGNAAGLFEIDAASGELFYTGGGEDYESSSTSFELTVRASDGDQTTDTPVAVSVTDVDEPVSEPAGEDFSANTSTSGRVVVGVSATGRIESVGDTDWFAVTLEAAKTYRFDLEGGWRSGGGTLRDPHLRGFYDANGDLIDGTTYHHDGGVGLNSRGYFTPDEGATYYVSAGAFHSHVGTYTLRVTEVSDDYAADSTTTGTVAVGGSATGNIEPSGDADWFAVTLEAGQLYLFDLERTWTDGGASYAPYLRGIYDEDGELIDSTTDDDNVAVHSRVYFTPEEDATYYVSAGLRGGGFGTYELTVTEVPNDDYADDSTTTGTVVVGGSATGNIETQGDTDWFAVTLEAGKFYRFDLDRLGTGDGTSYDPNLSGIYDGNGDRIDGAPDNYGGLHATYYVSASGVRRDQTGTYTLTVSDATDDYAADPTTTGTVVVGGSATGELQYEDDRDWFAVALEADKRYRIDLEGSFPGDGTLYDPYLRGIYDEDGELIDSTTDNDGGRGYNSRVFFTPDEDATYYVSAGVFNWDVGTYTLSVEEVDAM